MDNSHSQMVSLIWNIADDVLRDVFLRGQYRDVILPMVVLRRLDALLEPTKEKVDKEVASQREMKLEILDEDAIKDITGLSYFNTSKWTLNRLKSQASDNNDLLYDNFAEYLNGYSENVRDVLKNFDYFTKARKLADNDRLLAIIERITDSRINLADKEVIGPDGLRISALTNIGMGSIFEELLRRFNEENNEEAGEHFTPRDAITLLAQLVFEPVKDNLPQIISLYDPACGSGGMLTEGREYLLGLGVSPDAIQLAGTEINPETYAICKSDAIIKGVDPSGIHLGNTITENHFANHSFGFMLTNPPYGKSWKEDKKKIYHEKELLDERYCLTLMNFAGEAEVLDCTPRSSDGQMLFLLEEINKMKPIEFQPQGARIASIHNGSSLFTGDAGSGESNIRRHLVESNLVEAIIQLPNNIFYNTGISTYVWLLTNKKSWDRVDKIQLIDASQAFEKLRKNQGSRNCTLDAQAREMILRAHRNFTDEEIVEGDHKVVSKVFDGDDFRYYSVTIERPLRLRSQFNAISIDELLYDKGNLELSKWLYDTYKDKVFTGLESEMTDIKEYLQENEIKVKDKKLANLVSTAKWKERKALMEAAKTLHKEVGNDVYMDYAIFADKIDTAAKKLKLGLSASVLKTIARAMSVTDPTAQPVVKKEHKADAKDLEAMESIFKVSRECFADYGYQPSAKGKYIEYEPDSELRDTEKIPVKEDIYEYFRREVRPYVDDAWINIAPTKIGCEISFNKYFYKPIPLRTLEENQADIIDLDQKSQGYIKSLFELL